jgi:hypothetical protein
VLVAAVVACSSSQDRAFERQEPELFAPADGESFRRRPPRMLQLEWRKVPGATRYMVELEMQNPLTGVWMPAPVTVNKQSTSTERLFVEFPGDQPGRWRVVAYNINGAESRTSDWSHFEFLLP